jgi:DNA-binding protein YbaB
MRGKRNEMPVVVEIKRSRGRPKKGFMPPLTAPAHAIEHRQEEIPREPIANEIQWQEAEPAIEAEIEAAIEAGIEAMTAAELRAEPETEPAGVTGDGLGATDEAQGQPIPNGVLGNPETLAGDIRDQILNQIKRQQKPWQQMLNYEQAVLADQIYKISKESVAGALKIILNVPFAHVDVRIDKIAVDKEIKVALSAPLTGGTLAKIGDALHLEACLILASAAEFQGQRQAPVLDPDQPGLQLEEETAGHDHEAELI